MDAKAELIPGSAPRCIDESAPPAAYGNWAQLVRSAYAMVGDRQAAEELVQDAFVRTMRAGSRVENSEAFVRTTLVNLCKSFTIRRSRERELRRLGPDVVHAHEVDETLIALRRLRPKYRTVLALRYYDDLPIDAIAELLGLKAGTVKSLVHRGLRDLRAELEKENR
jgi:RNA polymerase sigma factor (sigma-70 family)